MSKGNYQKKKKNKLRVSEPKHQKPIISTPAPVVVLKSPTKQPKFKYSHTLTKIFLTVLLSITLLTIGCSRSNSFGIPYTPVKAIVSQYTINDLKISLDPSLDSQYNLVYRCIGENGYSDLISDPNNQSDLVKNIRSVQIYILPNSSFVDSKLDFKALYEHLNNLDLNSSLTSQNVLVDILSSPINLGTINFSFDLDGKSEVGSCVITNAGVRSITQLYLGIQDNEYRFNYRTELSNYGWLGWSDNYQLAGGYPHNYKLQTIQIVLRKPQQKTLTNDKPSYLEQPLYLKPVYYSQKDYRWGGKVYGYNSMSMAGCGPTSIAMCLSSILNENIYPDDVASWLYRNTNEYERISYGCSCKGVYLAANHYGVSADGIDSLDALREALSAGKLITGGVNFIGIYGFDTHMITFYGNNDGYTTVYDPVYGIYTESIRYLWNNRSRNYYDRRGGYVFYALY